jgi:phospholipase/lecithinase/hemolysin
MSIGNNIQRLWAAGARSFLVPNLPNIGNTPAIRALGDQARDAAQLLAEGYNAGLETALQQLETALGIDIVRLDVFTILDEVVDDPDLAGLTNVTESCITPDVIIGAICRNPPPRKYLFWDFIHPTKSAHKYLSEQARAALEMEFVIAAAF